MTPELIYMLKVNVGIALFYAFYKLFCGSDTFFKWRRIALLSFLTLSFLYPLLNIQTWIKEQPAIYELTDYYTLLITGNTNPMGIRIMVVQRTLTPPVGVRSSHPQPHRSSPVAAVFLYGV